jgi:hypothetical protein
MYVNGKRRSIESIPRLGRRRIKNGGRGEFKSEHIVRTFVNVTMYP